MLSIHWNTEIMSVGNNLIDSQHKKLVELITEIMLSIQNETQQNDLKMLVEKTFKYCEFHFKTEEDFYSKFEIEKEILLEHTKEHDEFRETAKEFMKEFDSIKSNFDTNEYNITINLYNYLTSWLVHHIIKEDKAMFKTIDSMTKVK